VATRDRDRTGDPLLAKPTWPVDRRQRSMISLEKHPLRWSALACAGGVCYRDRDKAPAKSAVSRLILGRAQQQGSEGGGVVRNDKVVIGPNRDMCNLSRSWPPHQDYYVSSRRWFGKTKASCPI
jgi:hypothetical protein